VRVGSGLRYYQLPSRLAKTLPALPIKQIFPQPPSMKEPAMAEPYNSQKRKKEDYENETF